MLTCFPLFTECDSVFYCALRDLHDDGIFISSLHVVFSVEALCISWLIQETALSNLFTCQCNGLALLGGYVDVMFPSVVLVFTLSYHSLSTATDVTEQVFCMYEVPCFCSSVLGITT
jgi:hypothetical protein